MREAYQPILERAVTYANQDSRKPWYLGGETFRTPPDFENLELWYEPSTVKGAIADARNRRGEKRTEDEVIRDLTIIVRDAVQQAIYEESEAFGALIIQKARENPNPENWFN